MQELAKLKKDNTFKSYIKQEIKKGYAVDNRYFSKNIEFYDELAEYILNYYLLYQTDYSFEGLLASNRDIQFLYNNGYRGSECRVRNGFYIWFRNLTNNENCYVFALSRNGQILDSNIKLSKNIKDIVDLYQYLFNSNKYDIYPIKRVLINHETDPKVGVYIISYVYNHLRTYNPEMVNIFVNDVLNYYELYLPEYVNHINNIFINNNDVKLILK